MKVIVLNREGMEQSTESAAHIKIVLHDPDLERPKVTEIESCKDVLYLAFDDISYESQYDKFFTQKDAHIVCQFLNKWAKFISTVLISCEAGRSRSPGMAASVDEFFNMRESMFFYDCSTEPNMLVYRKMKTMLESM